MGHLIVAQSVGLRPELFFSLSPRYPKGVGADHCGDITQPILVNSREGNAQLVDETQITAGLDAGGDLSGKPGLFSRQASGTDAHPNHRADQNAAPYVHLHPLLDADAAADAHRYFDARPAD